MSLSSSPAVPHAEAEGRTAIAVAAAFLLAGATAWLLSSLSHPAGETRREDQLEQRIAGLEAQRPSPSSYAYPRDALCHIPPLQEAAQLKADLQALARQIHAPLIEAAAAPLPEAAERAIPVQLTLDLNADYPGVLELMHRLSSYTPFILVDRTDVVSKGGYVHLHLQGRVLCRA